MEKVKIYFWSCFFMFVLPIGINSQIELDDFDALQIELTDLEVFIYPKIVFVQETIRTESYNDNEFGVYFIEVFLLDSQGKCKFNGYDVNNNIVVDGEYDSAIDTLKKYSYGYSARASLAQYPDTVIITNIAGIHIQKYFKPIKSGIWHLYDENGVKSEKLYYHLDQLIYREKLGENSQE